MNHGRDRTGPGGRSPRLLAALLLTIAVPEAMAQVSPADRSTLEGNAQSIYPLGRARARVMTLHGDVPASAILRGHAYRRDAIDPRIRVEAYRSRLTVSLSHSGLTPATGRSTFADNVADTPVLVLPETEISFPMTERPNVDPSSQFAYRIPYAQPFTTDGRSLCLDVRVLGNSTPLGDNRNFTPYLDAHESFNDGRAFHKSFGFGQGCGDTTPSLSLSLTLRATTLDLDLDQRNGVPSDGSGPAQSLLVLGVGQSMAPVPGRSCLLYPTFDTILPLPGENGPTGALALRVGTFSPLFGGLVFHGQTVSLQPATGKMAFSEGARMTTPPVAPSTLPALRIASGTDPDATTGALSPTATVTSFF